MKGHGGTEYIKQFISRAYIQWLLNCPYIDQTIKYVYLTTDVIISATSEIGHTVDIMWEVKVNMLENWTLSRMYI